MFTQPAQGKNNLLFLDWAGKGGLMNKINLVILGLLAGFIAMAAVLGISLTVWAQAQARAGDVWKEPVTGMDFVRIPAGEFMMGYSGGEADEQPVHKVHIDAFWMGKCEVTQGQWKAVMHNNPAYFKRGDDYPVEKVSWDDTQDFIAALSEQSGHHFRLPTEAEWEYACKSGTPGQRYGELSDIAWFGDLYGTTHPGGQKKSNAWGLNDMLGNVGEWCQDWYGEKYYATSPVANPPGPPSGSRRVLRGGSWLGNAQYVRSADRVGSDPSLRGNGLGFRLARTK
jgi:formylglycine-generating enzyme required for sulfatase activity